MDIESQRYISRLIFLYLREELSDSQKNALDDWRAESFEHELVFQRMISMEQFSQHFARFVRSPQEQEKEWSIIKSRTVVKEKRLKWRRWFRYAAVLVLPITLGLFGYLYVFGPEEEEMGISASNGHEVVLVLSDGKEIHLKDKNVSAFLEDWDGTVVADENQLSYQNGKPSENQENHLLIVPRGGEYTLILEDGSKVYLNAESKISYPVVFQGNLRQVYLEGEAYFEVFKDASRPFVVNVKGMAVEVLGTEFAVRAYPEEKKVLTTLVNGCVNVSAGAHSVALRPNEQAVWKKSTDDLQVEPVNVNLFVGWRNGRLVFDNVPLCDLLKELGRWYDFVVEYKNPDLQGLPFSLDIEKYSDFRQVLKLLECTGRVKFSISGNRVTVY